MNHSMRISALLGMLVIAAIPGAGQGLAQGPDDPAILGGMVRDGDSAVARVRDAITSFHGQYGRWPISLAELERYADDMGRPIDSAAFASSAYSVGEANGGSAALFEYTMVASGAKGAFAINFNSIE